MRQHLVIGAVAAALLVTSAVANAGEVRASLDDIDTQAGTITIGGHTMRLTPGFNTAALVPGTKYVVYYDDAAGGVPVVQHIDLDQKDKHSGGGRIEGHRN